MSQESTKEPAFLFGSWLRFCRGSLYEKGVWNPVCEQARPRLPSPFFSLLRKPAGRCPADCRLVDSCSLCRRFCCGKNERAGTPLRRRDSEASASATTQTMRQVDHAVRDRTRKAGRKKAEAEGRACSYIRLQPFFVLPAATFMSTKRRLSGGL